MDGGAYRASANEQIVTVLQVEHADSVANIDAIVRVPGIDSLLVGPADLSYSLGIPLEFQHSALQEALDVSIRAARGAGIPIGIAWQDTTEGHLASLKRGFSFIASYCDYNFLAMGATQWLHGMREAQGAAGPGGG